MSQPVKRAGRKAVNTEAIREPRGARRKRETRGRLLEAALKLMSEKGMEGVAINEITEAADVGFGSFYNHFDSKESIHAALVGHLFEEFFDQLDELGRRIDDPAEVIAVAVRHTLLRAQREPTWGKFLIREGLSSRLLTRSERLMRDVQRGATSKRLTVTDPLTSVIAVGGTILTAVATQLLKSHQSGAVTLGKSSFDTKDLPERAATVALQILGLSPREAEKIARRPLPALDATAE